MTKKQEREAVFNKFGGRCAYCGCELQKGWHVDHVEACRRIVSTEYSHEKRRYVNTFHGYGNPDANHTDNYFPSCPSCNINKGGNTIEGFRKDIEGYLRSLNLRMVQYKMVKKYGLIEETGKPIIFYFEKYKQQQ